jgi:C-terminal processing protease CtpA/Prc
MLIQLDPLQTGPLGIHVLPCRDDDEQCGGLIIKDIEPSSRIGRDGRISVDDLIIEVNNRTLLNVNFKDAQQIIAAALQLNDIRLQIIKNCGRKAIANASTHRDGLPNSVQQVTDSNECNRLLL